MPLYVITANRLRDGAAVWLGRDGGWDILLRQAAVFDEQTVETGLATGAAAVAGQRVVGVYKALVTLRDGVPAPESVRERIRAAGPSVRMDLGMQAAVEG